jgi:hypothetical protein
MKSHMETEQASMKSQMELPQAIVNYLQVMTDHMQKMKKNKGMMDEQKSESDSVPYSQTAVHEEVPCTEMACKVGT